MRSRLLHPLGIPLTAVEGEEIYTRKLPCRAVICKLNFCCREESALETYVTCDLWFYYFLLHFIAFFVTDFIWKKVLSLVFHFKWYVTSLQMWCCVPVIYRISFSSLRMEVICLPWQNGVPLSELEIPSLHSVLPWHKRDQFPLLRVICVKELSRRERWDDLEASVEENGLFFSGTIWRFASSMSQSTLKELKDFHWPLCSLNQTLHPVLLAFTGDDNPDLQLYIVSCLWVVVFLYCLCRVSHGGDLVLAEDS